VKGDKGGRGGKGRGRGAGGELAAYTCIQEGKRGEIL